MTIHPFRALPKPGAICTATAGLMIALLTFAVPAIAESAGHVGGNSGFRGSYGGVGDSHAVSPQAHAIPHSTPKAGGFVGNAQSNVNRGAALRGNAPHTDGASGGIFKPRMTSPFEGVGRPYSGGIYTGKPHRGGNGGSGQHSSDHDGYAYGHDRHHHRRHIYVYDVPVYSGDDDYNNGDRACAYYWQRYQRTGNPKWKYRYYDCIN